VWGLRLTRRPYDTLLDANARWGPVVQIGHGPLRFVFVLGRDANELVLSTRAKDFTWREAFASLIPVDGDTALVVSDGADHARRRRLVQPAFTQRRIQGYAPTILEEIDHTIAEWKPGAAIDLHAELKRTVRRIAIRTLFGDRLSERADELGEHLQVAIDFANLPPLPGRHLNLPGSPFRRAMRARNQADAIVFEEITRRRSEQRDEGDLLSALIAAQDADGSALTDQELRDQVVSLIAGGYHTTSALIAWALYATLADPDVNATLRAELESTLDTGAIDEDHISRCGYLHAVIMETLRLHSPAGFAGRKARADIDFAGHTIPAGAMVIYSQYVTHRDPDHFPDPLRFNPNRWIGPDGAPLDADPYTFVPFGGGYRRCIGFAMATLEAELIVAAVLQRCRLRLDRTDIAPTGIATVEPRGGVPATILDISPRPARRTSADC
jgi:hypothetical protein